MGNLGKLYTRRQLADMFGVHITTLRDWERKGIAPARICLGPHRICYSDKAIEQFITERTVTGAKAVTA